MQPKFSGFTDYIAFICAALLLAASSWYPETFVSLILEWAAVFFLVVAVKFANRLYSGFILFGFLLSICAYYWVPNTLSLFGGFPFWLSAFLFSLFSLLSSAQFLLCAWLYSSVRRVVKGHQIWILPLAWLISETLVPRVFPWKLSYMQVYWESFAGLAEMFGAGPLSFLMLLWVEAVVGIRSISLLGGIFTTLTLLFIPLGANLNQQARLQAAQATLVSVGVIQGNIPVELKSDPSSFEDNLLVYKGLSESAKRAGAQLLVWPESVVANWAPTNISSVRGTSYDPWPTQDLPLLYGGLSFEARSREEYNRLSAGLDDPELKKRLQYHSYNSAFLLDDYGSVQAIYHKQVLMPFGEYLPFREVWPRVRELSPLSGDFTAGKDTIVFSSSVPGKEFKFSPLICYEDMIPSVARDAVKQGAEFLVNLSNDAWYGTSVAPRQHHLLALWRSIELRRNLVRVTNTGHTALVNSLGRTVRELGGATEDYFVERVPLLQGLTVYARMGDRPLYLLSLILLGIIAVFRLSLRPKFKNFNSR